MNGTVIKRGGTYSVVLDLGRGPDGKRIRKWHSGYKTKKAANDARIELLAAVNKGTYTEPTKLAFGEYLTDHWLPSVRVRPTTLAQYRRNINAHVVPALGGVPLAKLNAQQLDAFYKTLEANGRSDGRGGLAPKSVRNIHALIRQALGDAVRWEMLARNVAESAKPPKHKAVEMHPWTPDQLKVFLGSVKTDRLFALWFLEANTGMRRGELLGLRWSDVELDYYGEKGGRLSIRQSLTIADYKVMIVEPKTEAGKREIALDAPTVKALRRHLVMQRQERLKWGEGWTDSGLVFTKENGEHIHPERLSAWFQQRLKAAGLPRIRLHDLRHSYVTMMLRDGTTPLLVVSQRVGHASPTITSTIYSHVLAGDDEKAAAAGGRLLGI